MLSKITGPEVWDHMEGWLHASVEEKLEKLG